jgi:hypothetical protein
VVKKEGEARNARYFEETGEVLIGTTIRNVASSIDWPWTRRRIMQRESIGGCDGYPQVAFVRYDVFSHHQQIALVRVKTIRDRTMSFAIRTMENDR